MIKFIRTLFILVATCVALVAVYMISNGQFMGYKIYKIASGSMLPELHVNDNCLFKEVEFGDELTVGDIYVYNDKKGKEICHRLIRINGDGTYTFKGDNNTAEDATPVSKNQITFKYVQKVN